MSRYSCLKTKTIKCFMKVVMTVFLSMFIFGISSPTHAFAKVVPPCYPHSCREDGTSLYPAREISGLHSFWQKNYRKYVKARFFGIGGGGGFIGIGGGGIGGIGGGARRMSF